MIKVSKATLLLFCFIAGLGLGKVLDGVSMGTQSEWGLSCESGPTGADIVAEFTPPSQSSDPDCTYASRDAYGVPFTAKRIYKEGYLGDPETRYVIFWGEEVRQTDPTIMQFAALLLTGNALLFGVLLTGFGGGSLFWRQRRAAPKTRKSSSRA